MECSNSKLNLTEKNIYLPLLLGHNNFYSYSKIIVYVVYYKGLNFSFNLNFLKLRPYTAHYQKITTMKKEVEAATKWRFYSFQYASIYIFCDIVYRNIFINQNKEFKHLLLYNVDLMIWHIFSSLLFPYLVVSYYMNNYSKYFVKRFKNYNQGRKYYFLCFGLASLVLTKPIDYIADFLQQISIRYLNMNYKHYDKYDVLNFQNNKYNQLI